MDYKSELLNVLGLPAAADDEQITNARLALGRESAGMQRELQACQVLGNEHKALSEKYETLLNSVIETDMTRFSEVIGEDKDHWKGQLVSNRDGTVKVLENMAKKIVKPAARTPVHNASTARTPGATTGEGATADAERFRVIKNRALDMLKRGEASTYDRAFSAAAQLIG
jgi:hypothetical protein